MPQVRDTVRDLIKWNRLAPDIRLIERAWYRTDTAQVSWWDALILASTERLECRYLLSEDFQSGRELRRHPNGQPLPVRPTSASLST